MKSDEVETDLQKHLKLKETHSESQTDQNEPPDASSKEQFGNLNLGDRFEVQQLIGHGGMGAVYKAFDRVLERIVAVKIMQSDLAQDQSAMKRFDQEVEAASNLNHQNLVAVYGHGRTEAGAPYMVMEFFEGESLSELLKRENHLRGNRALDMFLHICDGLKHAHKQAVIHRDIKPSNVIVSHAGTSEESSKLVDFGIARIINVTDRHTRSLTETGEVFGSPHYMSPEHCLGFMMDHRSDIYSLGCLMYEALTGEPPFQANNPIQVVVKHINQEPKRFPASITNDRTMRRLESVVLRCLEKEPEARYQSIEELEKDLNLIKSDKEPAKFKQRKKEKAEFTKQQFVGLSVGGLILLGCAMFFLNTTLGYGAAYGAAAFLTFVATACGAYYFPRVALQRWKTIRAGNSSNGNWWLCFLQGSLALFCVACVLVIATMPVARQLIDVRKVLHLLQGISCFFLLSSTLGWLFFLKNRNNSLGRVTFSLQYLGVLAIIVLSAFTIFHHQTSSLVLRLSRTLPIDSPSLETQLVDLAIQIDPNNVDAHTQAIRTVRLDGDPREAIRMCDDLIRAGMKYPSILRQKALAHEDLKNYYEAIKDWTSLIGIDPENDDAYSSRASNKFSLGDHGGAIQDYDMAIRYDPTEVAYYQYKAEVHCAIGQYWYALKELNTALNAYYDDAGLETFMLRGLIYDHLNQPENAKNSFIQVVRIVKDMDEPSANQYLMGAYAAARSGYTNYQSDFLERAKQLGKTMESLPKVRLIRVSEIPLRLPIEASE